MTIVRIIFYLSILTGLLSAQTPNNATSSDTVSQINVLEEMGYVFAMETVFTGMSYLSSREQWYGPAITGGFDLFMGLAGLENASIKELESQKIGHYIISSGFIAKSMYNFHYGKKHNKKTRFWTNFIGYNLLVFAGYYLDTLN
ncbi:MAG: hypothetical protein ISR82_07820 [Candidatus Marinimicrobia bacterium]|nr:hypothetical protein [Candidatus Neomarinimicrobiota bacterium]MBL7030132.1 hypothetical protein [Candidatus Neomarinimicrobiota bacterium]